MTIETITLLGMPSRAAFIILAAIVGVSIHCVLVRRAGFRIRQVVPVYLGLVLVGLFGAKLFSLVVENSTDQFLAGQRHFGAVLAMILAIPMLGSMLPSGMTIRQWGDLIVPGMGISFAIIRIDCFLVGCCVGGVCHLPWGVHYPHRSLVWLTQNWNGLIPGDAAYSLPVHPLYAYFFLLAITGSLLSVWLLGRKRYHGQVVLFFIAFHEIGKGLLESLREPYNPTLQATSLVLGLAAATLYGIHEIRSRRTASITRT